MSYPSTITALTNPNPTDRLNAPSHSGIETAQNTEITAIETFVGTISSTAGSLVYDIRSPNSGGGGHVQTAAKGGTGQTSFNKGDLLVGQSSSVLTRLAVGVDGQIPSANSSVATGVTWIDNSRPKISTTASVITLIGNVNETSVLSTVIPASTLGTSNAVRSTTYVSNWNPRSSVLVKALYGGNAVASVILTVGGGVSAYDSDEALAGTIGYTIIANNSANLQRNFLSFQLVSRTGVSGPTSSVYSVTNVTTSSIVSSASQTMGVTVKESTSGDGFVVSGTIVEKIN